MLYDNYIMVIHSTIYFLVNNESFSIYDNGIMIRVITKVYYDKCYMFYLYTISIKCMNVLLSVIFLKLYVKDVIN